MSNKNKKAALDYPETTTGSKVAAEARSEANDLTDAEREQHFRQGMSLIYGGKCERKAVGVRH